MSVPCPNTQPHRSHPADNAHGICGGVPRPEDAERARRMVLDALKAADRACAYGVPACSDCLTDAFLDLSVFEPVLFPEETQ